MGKDPIVELIINGNPKLKKYGEEVLHVDTPVFAQGDAVSGILEIQPQDVISHKGVKILLIGEFRNTSGKTVSRIFTRKQELLPNGEISTTLKTNFTFDNLRFPTPSYKGTAVNVVYSIVLIIKHIFFDFKIEKTFTVLNFDEIPESAEPQRTDVGIRNVLQLEFVFPNPIVDCNGVLIGNIYFILVKLRITNMKIVLHRIETFISDDIYFRKKTLLKKFEIMDGPPARGDHVPIRLFLGDIGIWPFQEFKGSMLTVSHCAKVVFFDELGRKYFKKLKIEIKRLKNDNIFLNKIILF